MKARVLSLALAGLLAATAANAQTTATMFNATTLSLSADGQVKVDPDEATVTIGVQTTAPTAQAAMTDNAQRMTALIAALKAAGLPDRDIQTWNINLSAQYNYVQNEAPKLAGYQATDDVTVTVEDLRRLGPVIDAATGAGANQVQGIAFGLKNPVVAENAARVAAVKALAAKADVYTGALGYRIGRLVNLSEGGGYQPQPLAREMMVSAAHASPSTPVQSGQLTVTISVSAIYELTR
jgi:uncharacterized protein YggE